MIEMKSSIVFSGIAPHAPILLPSVGSKEDRQKLKKTIKAFEFLAENFKKSDPDIMIISSPHTDWGFNVPLFFIAEKFSGETKPYLTGLEPPQFYFEKGKKTYKQFADHNKKIAILASGDLSHCLKKDGPYGFNPDGPKFDNALIKNLRERNIDSILKLDENFPEAGECGLRSFCFMLGIMEESKTKWKAETLSYEGPFGVGYLVLNLKI